MADGARLDVGHRAGEPRSSVSRLLATPSLVPSIRPSSATLYVITNEPFGTAIDRASGASQWNRERTKKC